MSLDSAVLLRIDGFEDVRPGTAVREPGESESSALGRADAALYGVKHDGRDGVRLAGLAPRESVAAQR